MPVPASSPSYSANNSNGGNHDTNAGSAMSDSLDTDYDSSTDGGSMTEVQPLVHSLGATDSNPLTKAKLFTSSVEDGAWTEMGIGVVSVVLVCDKNDNEADDAIGDGEAKSSTATGLHDDDKQQHEHDDEACQRNDRADESVHSDADSIGNRTWSCHSGVNGVQDSSASVCRAEADAPADSHDRRCIGATTTGASLTGPSPSGSSNSLCADATRRTDVANVTPVAPSPEQTHRHRRPARVQSARLVMVALDDASDVLLSTPISPDEDYVVQSDTILVWADASLGRDVACSFNTEQGCAYIVAQITAYQQQHTAENTAEANGLAGRRCAQSPNNNGSSKVNEEANGNSPASRASSEEKEDEDEDEEGASDASREDAWSSPYASRSTALSSASSPLRRRVCDRWFVTMHNLPHIVEAATTRSPALGAYVRDHANYFARMVTLYRRCRRWRHDHSNTNKHNTKKNNDDDDDDKKNDASFTATDNPVSRNCCRATANKSMHSSTSDVRHSNTHDDRANLDDDEEDDWNAVNDVDGELAGSDMAGMTHASALSTEQLLCQLTLTLLRPPYSTEAKVIAQFVEDELLDSCIDMVQRALGRCDAAHGFVSRAARRATFRDPCALPATYLSRIHVIHACTFLKDLLPLSLDEGGGGDGGMSGGASGSSLLSIFLQRFRYALIEEICHAPDILPMAFTRAIDGLTALASPSSSSSSSLPFVAAPKDEEETAKKTTTKMHTASPLSSPARPSTAQQPPSETDQADMDSAARWGVPRVRDLVAFCHDISTTIKGAAMPLEPKEELYTRLIQAGMMHFFNVTLRHGLAELRRSAHRQQQQQQQDPRPPYAGGGGGGFPLSSPVAAEPDSNAGSQSGTTAPPTPHRLIDHSPAWAESDGAEAAGHTSSDAVAATNASIRAKDDEGGGGCRPDTPLRAATNSTHPTPRSRAASPSRAHAGSAEDAAGASPTDATTDICPAPHRGCRPLHSLPAADAAAAASASVPRSMSGQVSRSSDGEREEGDGGSHHHPDINPDDARTRNDISRNADGARTRCPHRLRRDTHACETMESVIQMIIDTMNHCLLLVPCVREDWVQEARRDARHCTLHLLLLAMTRLRRAACLQSVVDVIGSCAAAPPASFGAMMQFIHPALSARRRDTMQFWLHGRLEGEWGATARVSRPRALCEQTTAPAPDDATEGVMGYSHRASEHGMRWRSRKRRRPVWGVRPALYRLLRYIVACLRTLDDTVMLDPAVRVDGADESIGAVAPDWAPAEPPPPPPPSVLVPDRHTDNPTTTTTRQSASHARHEAHGVVHARRGAIFGFKVLQIFIDEVATESLPVLLHLCTAAALMPAMARLLARSTTRALADVQSSAAALLCRLCLRGDARVCRVLSMDVARRRGGREGAAAAAAAAAAEVGGVWDGTLTKPHEDAGRNGMYPIKQSHSGRGGSTGGVCTTPEKQVSLLRHHRPPRLGFHLAEKAAPLSMTVVDAAVLRIVCDRRGCANILCATLAHLLTLLGQAVVGEKADAAMTDGGARSPTRSRRAGGSGRYDDDTYAHRPYIAPLHEEEEEEEEDEEEEEYDGVCADGVTGRRRVPERRNRRASADEAGDGFCMAESIRSSQDGDPESDEEEEEEEEEEEDGERGGKVAKTENGSEESRRGAGLARHRRRASAKSSEEEEEEEGGEEPIAKRVWNGTTSAPHTATHSMHKQEPQEEEEEEENAKDRMNDHDDGGDGAHTDSETSEDEERDTGSTPSASVSHSLSSSSTTDSAPPAVHRGSTPPPPRRTRRGATWEQLLASVMRRHGEALQRKLPTLAERLWHCLRESPAEAAQQQQWEAESSRSVLSALEQHVGATTALPRSGAAAAAMGESMHAGLAFDYDAVAYEFGGVLGSVSADPAASGQRSARSSLSGKSGTTPAPAAESVVCAASAPLGMTALLSPCRSGAATPVASSGLVLGDVGEDVV